LETTPGLQGASDLLERFAEGELTDAEFVDLLPPWVNWLNHTSGRLSLLYTFAEIRRVGHNCATWRQDACKVVRDVFGDPDDECQALRLHKWNYGNKKADLSCLLCGVAGSGTGHYNKPFCIGFPVSSRSEVLAQGAYDTRLAGGRLDPAHLAVLADSLEEEGCPLTVISTRNVNVQVRAGDPGWQVVYTSPSLPKTVAFTSPRWEKAVEWAEKYLYARNWVQSKWPRGVKKKHRLGEGVLKFPQPNPVLEHLRTPVPHYPGCWAVDLLLRKM
jgi:hypothetical protein